MFKSSFKWKIISTSCIVMILSMSVLVTLFNLMFVNISHENGMNLLKNTSSTVLDSMNERANITRLGAIYLSNDARILKAISDNDRETLLDISTGKLQELNASYFSFTDREGMTIARTFDPSSFGDSVFSNHNIREALAGRTFSELGTTPYMPVVTKTTVPAYMNGRVIGTVTVGFRYDTEEFIDSVKTNFGVESTLLYDNKRVATTVKNSQGERITGTQIQSPEIIKIVDSGMEFYGEAKINDEAFYAAYLPLKDSNGSVFAMFFVGQSQQTTIMQRNNIVFFSILASIGALITAIIVLTAILGTISKPIAHLAEDLTNLAKGRIGNRFNITSNDEIGILASGITNVSDTIKLLIDEISIKTEKFHEGYITAEIPVDKFSGCYADIADKINFMMTASKYDTIDILESVNEIANGNFDTRLREMPNEKVVANKTIDNIKQNIINVRNDILMLAQSAVNGELHVRADESKYKGDWAKLISELNQVLIAVASPIEEASDVLKQMAKGNLSVTVKGHYRGNFATIKDSLNTMGSSVSSYIKEINSILKAMSDGDLTSEIFRDYLGDFDSIKYSINTINGSLCETMSEIYAVSEQVLTGAIHISQSATALADGATRQTSDLQILTESITTTNDQTQYNAVSAESANELSKSSIINAEKGNKAMSELLKAMEDIEKASLDISNIILVIDEIAFQTDLLALNASVEAAHAGIHGKGFAVVAEQVRDLASRSQAAASDTTELINNSIERVSYGKKIAEKTAEEFGGIVDSINNVSDIVQHIAEASKEQAESLASASTGIAQITNVVQSNSAVAEQSAAASEELNSQATQLKHKLSFFNLN